MLQELSNVCVRHPQGRGYRVRKRSNHVTVIVDTKATKN